MPASIAERRNRIRRTVAAGTAAGLAVVWAVVAVAGKGPATSSAAVAPAAQTRVAPDQGGWDGGYDDGQGYGGGYDDQGGSYDPGAGTQQSQSPGPMSSGQS